MSMPVKISDALLTLAKQEAEVAQRSITAQVEHWARIGRAVEVIVAHQELMALKRVGDVLAPVFPSAARREEMHHLLARLVEHPDDREEAKAIIEAAGAPVYEADPARPGRIVQVSSDGSRRPGRLKGRRFVPEGTR